MNLAMLLTSLKKKPISGNPNNHGYMICMVRAHGQIGYKNMSVHRFIWESYNGKIPDNKVIDHINNDRTDNRLCNLQIVTPQVNNKKSAIKRDYSFVKNNRKNKKCVKAINLSSGEVTYFNSLYKAQQGLGINAGIIKQICENKNFCKTGKSKIDNDSYRFEYVDNIPN